MSPPGERLPSDRLKGVAGLPANLLADVVRESISRLGREGRRFSVVVGGIKVHLGEGDSEL